MVTQREVLAFIAERAADGQSVGVGQVGDQFWLSADAAAGHLWRLWRERLVEATSARPAHYRFRLKPGESILALRFRTTRRGQQRLRWYDQVAGESSSGLLFP